jgi:hypothetical protein
MPQEVINGSAILHGIRNDGTAIDIDYLAFIDTSKVQHKFKLDAIEDEQGFDASLIATNEHYECDITLTPKGATRAAVEAAVVVLEPLASVAFTHFSVAIFNGTWIYVGDQSIELSKGKEGKVTLKFRKYADSTQNTSLSTTVSG